ncbi:hypothetical protein O6H91_01G174600 [Diphasiastrum complanatum]|uniref:Uncharacterized protein n=1 Tax=Diphasiastrum complanatum TaxID=34168 RepID=A0ACC2EZ64_DIPCM|nr:hypothetical protein O6H91_01G174600 [Diphasiastrum complanatum]
MGDAAVEENLNYVLLVRNGAWGLPTACPNCLPSYLYLKFAGLTFEVEYAPRLPDSEDLPILEYGLYAAFSSETGGIEGFLKNEKIADLDSGLTDSEKLDLQVYKALTTSWLADATLCELWSKDNDAIAREVYFSSLPWPISKILNWKMHRSAFQKLGITAENASYRKTEILSKATAAYEALALRLGDQKYFFESKPTSLDAVVLGHILFHLHAPLENPTLKDEIQKHKNLVMYAEVHKAELLANSIPSFSYFSPAPASASTSTSASRSTASTSTAATSEKTQKKADIKDAIFKKRARYFVLTQLAVVILYVVLTGIRYEEETIEDDNNDDD